MIRVFTHPDCLLHLSPPGFPELPQRLRLILERLRRDGFTVIECADHPEAEEAAQATHAGGYVDRFRRAVERGDGLLDSADNPLSPGTWTAALAAVSASLAAADWTAADAGRRAFVAVRPPGHHAERETAMGFCYFNNVAVAADHLRRRHGLERLAIFDFDVHHGNGTQHLFEEHGDVLYVSTHQFPFYPGTGSEGERGWGDGEGATVNVPLPAGTGDEGYRQALESRVEPSIRDFRPELLLVSAGFDTWRYDPLGGMRVGRRAIADWGRRLAALADELCEGRMLICLEGGYDLESLPGLVSDHLRAIEAP
jgi:acetoin utilization deacetylase AcuC-like enzyme